MELFSMIPRSTANKTHGFHCPFFSHQTIHTDVSYCSRRYNVKNMSYSHTCREQSSWVVVLCLHETESPWAVDFSDREVLQCPALTNLNQSLLNQPGVVTPQKWSQSLSENWGPGTNLQKWRRCLRGVAILDGHCMTFTWREVASKLEA